MVGCYDMDATMPPWQAAATAPFLPELGPPATAPAITPTVVRIASWNVATGEDPQSIAAAIQGSMAVRTADVLLVQEIEAYPDEPGSRAARLATALGMTWFYAPARSQGDGTHGDAILSRFPISDPEIKLLPFVHQPIHENQRIAQRAILDLGEGRRLVVVNLHLDTRLGPVDRIRQLDPAVSDNPDEVVIGGDLNTMPWTWVETAIPLVGPEAIVGQDQAQIVDDYFRSLGFATPIAHDVDTHASLIDMRLDTICPRDVTAVTAGVDDEVDGSDHYPVWIDLEIGAPRP